MYSHTHNIKISKASRTLLSKQQLLIPPGSKATLLNGSGGTVWRPRGPRSPSSRTFCSERRGAKKRCCEKERFFRNSQQRFFSTRGYPCASFWRVRMNVRKLDNLRKDIAYPAMSPILHLRFWGEHVLIWYSTCIVRTRILGVRHWRLQANGKPPRASVLDTTVSIE